MKTGVSALRMGRCGLLHASLAVLALGAVFTAQPVRAQHFLPMDTTALVDGAGAIVIGDVVSATPRWNEYHNLILTDYRLQVEETLLGDARRGSDLVLTQAGGTLDGETHELSSSAMVEPGQRYLVFVDPAAGLALTPFLGGGLGLRRIDADGMARGDGVETRAVSELLAEIQAAIMARGSRPPKLPQSLPPEGVMYPGKTGIRLRAPFSAAASGGSGFVPETEQQDEFESSGPVAPPDATPVGQGRIELLAAQARAADADPPQAPDWVVTGPADLPIVWDEWPHHWAQSPHDQYMMSRWNGIITGLNRVSGSQLDTWSFGNGRYEMVGWLDDVAMLDQFGLVWSSNQLAIAVSRFDSSGNRLEADIALNVAVCWTLDELVAQDSSSGCWGIDAAVLHELGHGWGLKHPWETQNVSWDSVMNYVPKPFRYPWLHRDDVRAARATYPTWSWDLSRDSQIMAYIARDKPGSNSAEYVGTFTNPAQVSHGWPLAAGAFQVENIGVGAFLPPGIEVYLNQGWNSWTKPYHLVGSATFGSPLEFDSTWHFTITGLTIPDSIPVGYYYPTLYLRREADDPSYNNTASAPPDRRVLVRNLLTWFQATTTWQTWQTGRVGLGGVWKLSLVNTIPGRTYELSLCPALGNGWADFDTRITVPGITTNDDYCGLASRVQFVATSQTVPFEISGYNNAAQGSFRIAYRMLPLDLIFRNGFEY